jgi:glycosyltransferase involved in cell wall biosynthesis
VVYHEVISEFLKRLFKEATKNIRKSKSKKIAIVSSVMPATNYSTYLIDALQKKTLDGIDVIVYTGKEEANLKVSIKNIKLIWNKNIIFPFQILRQVLKDKPDILHIQHEINMFGGTATAIVFPILPILLKLVGVKVVITIHAVVARKDINKDFLETFFGSGREILILFTKLFFSLLYRAIGFSADKIFVHADILKYILINDYKIKKDKIIVICHGVPDKIEFDKNYRPICSWIKLISDKPFILYYGYFHKRKGIEIIIKSFEIVLKKFPELNLVIAGGTLQKDYEQKIKILIRKLNIGKNVIFTGFVEEMDLGWLLSSCKLILLPAIYSISASGPLAQVIAYHKPVIVSDVGVFKEEITNYIDGLVTNNSIECWAEQIELLIRDKKLYENISYNLQKKHIERKWSRIAEITNSIYQKL